MGKLIGLTFLILFTSCGLTDKEIGRLSFDKVTTAGHVFSKQVTLNLKKDDDISFWSEMDVEYTGKVKFQFEIIVIKNNVPYTRIKIDPMKKNITIGEIRTAINGNVNWSFTGKNIRLKIPENGKYIFKGIFIVNTDRNYKVEKSELVIKT